MAEKSVGMGIAIANALITDIPLSLEQLDAAYRHYAKLAEIMTHSGPGFSDARILAVSMGNRALERLRRQRDDAAAAARAKKADDGLETIR